jgi:hypothetical protein
MELTKIKVWYVESVTSSRGKLDYIVESRTSAYVPIAQNVHPVIDFL